MDIITLGIGPGGDIPHLVLTGLGVLSSSSEVPSVGSLGPGQVVTFFDLFPSEGGISSEIGILPGGFAVEISWQVLFASPPGVASILLELSLNGLDWFAADEVDNVAGDLRQIYTSAKFMRVTFGTMTDGILTTVNAVASPVSFIPL